MVNYLICSDLPFDLFIKTRLKTAIKGLKPKLRCMYFLKSVKLGV